MNQSVTLGGGCFWCLDAAYRQVKGVESVTSGYTGGRSPDPTYEDVSSGTTGHAEVVRVTYDPTLVSLENILSVFWTIHDPTTLNRQGADVGTQYRSCIFYEDDEQRDTIDRSMAAAEQLWGATLTTEVRPLGVFYPAEDYHQDYFTKNQGAGYCQVIIEPKLAKLRQNLQSLLG